VAGLESPSSQSVRLHNQISNTCLIKVRPEKTISEEKMENKRTSNPNLAMIAWGALFILWGITEMFQSLPEGTGAVGIGLILLGLNVVRAWKGQPTSVFSTTLGFLALLMGGLQLARAFLNLPFELPIFAILLIVLGIIILARQLIRSRKE
jgi:hypothetical protein